MIETVDNRDELIKYSFNIIWKATEAKITKATFNTNPLFSVTFFLNDKTSEILYLDAPNVVLIKRENFLKVLNLTEQNEVPIIIEINSNKENLNKDQGSEFQYLDPVTYSSMIQENIMPAEDINLDRQPSDLSLELDFVNMDIDDNSIEFNNSVSPPFEENEIIQKNLAQNLNEYDNTDEEINEMIFDALASSRAKSNEISSAKNSTRKSKDGTIKSKKNKHSVIECIPSTLSEDSPLPSEKEAISVLQ
ncbi:3884_t:CDS:2, partial [Gigaspora margarita]